MVNSDDDIVNDNEEVVDVSELIIDDVKNKVSDEEITTFRYVFSESVSVANSKTGDSKRCVCTKFVYMVYISTVAVFSSL